MARCVVIEDSSRVREIAIELLGELGIAAEGVPGAEEGTRMIEASPPEFVLLDWDLPKLGALDVLSAMAQSGIVPKPKIILMATENDPKQFAMARAAGANHYVLKPFDRNDLAQALVGAGIEIAQAAH